MSAETPQQRAGLDHLRARILSFAAAHGIEVVESVKWGQASFVSKDGSPVRIGLPKDGGFAIYAHCATTLISDYAALSPAKIEGNRAVVFNSIAEAEVEPLEALIGAALQYHKKP